LLLEAAGSGLAPEVLGTEAVAEGTPVVGAADGTPVVGVAEDTPGVFTERAASSFVFVCGPTRPSGARPCDSWNAITAS
jgi:hypothetical protein